MHCYLPVVENEVAVGEGVKIRWENREVEVECGDHVCT